MLESDGESWFYFQGKKKIEKTNRDLLWDSDGKSTFIWSSSSDTLNMNANTFYKIKIEYRHCCHWSWTDPNKSYLKLLWRMETKQKEEAPGIIARRDRFGVRRMGGKISIMGGGGTTTIINRNSIAYLDSGFGGDGIEFDNDWASLIMKFKGGDGRDNNQDINAIYL